MQVKFSQPDHGQNIKFILCCETARPHSFILLYNSETWRESGRASKNAKFRVSTNCNNIDQGKIWNEI